MGKLRHFFSAGLGIFIFCMVSTHRSDGAECGSQITSPGQKCSATAFNYNEQRLNNNGPMIVGGIIGVILLIAGVLSRVARNNNMNATNESRSSVDSRSTADIRSTADYRGKLRIDFLEAVRGTVKSVDLPIGVVLRIVIPAGIKDGHTYFLPGIKGPNSEGGKAWNVYIEVSINPHPVFTRSGLDIFMDVPISARDAAEGVELGVPTPNAIIDLIVPKGTVSGDMLRFNGLGIRCETTGAVGHQYVRFVVNGDPAHAQTKNIEPYYDVEKKVTETEFLIEAEIGTLIEELIQLGRSNKFLIENSGGHRTREIGEILDRKGGMDLMRFAHSRVDRVLGGGLARELEVAWDSIGGWLG